MISHRQDLAAHGGDRRDLAAHGATAQALHRYPVRGGGVQSSRSVLPELDLLRMAAACCGRTSRPGVGRRHSARGGGTWRSLVSPAAAPLAGGVLEPRPKICRDPIACEICLQGHDGFLDLYSGTRLIFSFIWHVSSHGLSNIISTEVSYA
jgi:hypothetical protein